MFSGYYLALDGEGYKRGLTNISYKTIGFDLKGYLLFDSIESLNNFRHRWNNHHFFNFDYLINCYFDKDKNSHNVIND